MAAVKYDEGFEVLWSGCWRRVAKAAAFKAWLKLDEEDRQLCLDVVGAHAQEYARSEMSYRPHLATWLNGRQFEDELSDPMEHERAQDVQQRAYEEMGWGGLVQS